MMRRPAEPNRFAIRAAVVCLAAFAVTAAFEGCQAFGGHPGGDVATPDAASDAGFLACTESGTCVPDPGSRPTDCSVASGIETLPIVTFDDPNTQTGYFKAEAMYVYTDNTAPAWFSNGQSECPASLPPAGQTTCGFEPWTEEADLCRKGDYALHLVGGPFLGWGGGIGVSMQKLNGRDTVNNDVNKALCLTPDGGTPNPVCPPADAEYAVRVAALDVSQYEGVSFWARRGPRSQAGLRVAVGDKHTDDDLNYYAVRQSALTGVQEPIYCQRVKECGCLYEGPCTYYDAFDQFWCRDPSNLQTQAQCSGNSLNGLSMNCLCGAADVCNTADPAFPNDAPIGADGQPITTLDPRSGQALHADTAFYGRACTPYSFTDGTGTSFCFNPRADPPPAPGSERCGDHWVSPVDLTTDWQFFRVPFTDMRQQGFAKKAETLDLHSVSVVRFTWDVGYIDYWVDDVSFYKRTE